MHTQGGGCTSIDVDIKLYIYLPKGYSDLEVKMLFAILNSWGDTKPIFRKSEQGVQTCRAAMQGKVPFLTPSSHALFHGLRNFRSTA